METLTELESEYLDGLRHEVRSMKRLGGHIARDAAMVVRSHADRLPLYPGVVDFLEESGYETIRSRYTSDRRWDRDLIPEIRSHLREGTSFDEAGGKLSDGSLEMLRLLGLTMYVLRSVPVHQDDERFADLSDDALERLDQIYASRVRKHRAEGLTPVRAEALASLEVFGDDEGGDAEGFLLYPYDPSVLISDARRVWELDAGFRSWAQWVREVFG